MENSQMLDLDFIVIDFETATPNMNSACSVGAAIVSGLKIVDSFYSLIQPPENQYSPKNTEIHGISAIDTEQSDPAWIVLRQLLPFLNCSVPVVAHNTSFDMSVLYHCLGDHIPDFKYMDTMDMVKPHIKGKRDLSSCAEYFGITLDHHHNALNDAITCAKVAIKCFELSPFPNFAAYCLRTPCIKLHSFSKLKPRKYISFEHHHLKTNDAKLAHALKNDVDYRSIVPCEGEKDPRHPLYGKNIVFTGTLSINRATAMQMVADVGAILKGEVSRKTDYLVVGIQDKALVGDNGMSLKEEKAYAWNAAGQANIRIIREAEFFALLNQKLEGIR